MLNRHNILVWRYLSKKINVLTSYKTYVFMYFYKQLQNIKRPVEKDVTLHYFLYDSVEIDNPLHNCKISVPCFIESKPEKPVFASMKAISFGLQTLFEAGVPLKPATIVNGSYLREVEKFIDSVNSKKL